VQGVGKETVNLKLWIQLEIAKEMRSVVQIWYSLQYHINYKHRNFTENVFATKVRRDRATTCREIKKKITGKTVII
jgi:hypothetical protein